MRKAFIIFILLLLYLIPLSAGAQWVPDTLGDGYQMRYVDQGADYAGPVRCAVVRKPAPCPGCHRGVLYVHGYNDYFFQKEMGDRFVDSCYNFYAVDLRRYGRSIMPGQRKFDVRDLSEYYADIDSALAIMKAAGIDEIALMGHSTGGLITSLYIKEKPDPDIRCLILNSPFLEWNMGAGMRKFVIPMVACLGSHHPGLLFSNGHSTAYGESLLASHHGEWDYNTDWKTLHPQKVTSGWVKAIDEGHNRVHNGRPILVPVLLMHSDKSIHGNEWTPEFQTGDAVLNVSDIAKYGRLLGARVTEATVANALHDIMLSNPESRAAAYDAIFAWLREQMP